MDEFKQISLTGLRHAKRESKYIDFKETIDFSIAKEWCELVKDIVSMANSGGGCILVGYKNNGDPSDFNVMHVVEMDNAQITDQITKYTGISYPDFAVNTIQKNGKSGAAIIVKPVSIPLVFIKPGTYQKPDGKQDRVFSQGQVYFRHGSKSEPGNTNDLRDFVERLIEHTRKSWLGGIRKIVDAPQGYKVHLLPPNVIESDSPQATPIRIVNDPSAPAYHKINPDATHPYRQKEVVTEFNKRIIGTKINSYDIRCIRKQYKVDENQMYFYKSKFATPQYSLSFVDWMVEEYKKDKEIFIKCRKFD